MQKTHELKIKKPDQYKMFSKQIDGKVQTKLDLKTLNTILGATIKELKSRNLYNETGGVYSDYEQINFAMNKVYSYIYDNKNCNLSSEDIKIFVSYLTGKISNLKNIVDTLEKKGK